MHRLKHLSVILVAAGLILTGCDKKSEPQSATTSGKASTTASTVTASKTTVHNATKSSPDNSNKESVAGSEKAETKTATPKENTPSDKATGTATDSSKTETASSPAIATVNGQKIPDVTFQAELDKRTSHAGKIPDDRLLRIKQTILRRLVDEVLIQQAVDAAKITIPDAKLEESMAEYKGRFESEERFQNYLRHGKITLDNIKQQRLKRLKVEVLLLQRGAFEVTDKEAQAFYQKNKRFYVEKAGVKASHILVKLGKTASKAQEKAAKGKIKLIQKELKEGKAFADVAKRMSEDLSAPRGGDLGFFGKGHMVTAFEKEAFAIPLKKVSSPVRTHFGYHLIKIHERREERVRTYDEVRDQIQRSLVNKLYFMKRRQLLSDLKNTAVVESLLPGVSY